MYMVQCRNLGNKKYRCTAKRPQKRKAKKSDLEQWAND